MIYVLVGFLVCIAILRWDLSNQLTMLLSLQVAIDDVWKSLNDLKTALEDTRARLESSSSDLEVGGARPVRPRLRPLGSVHSR